MVGHRDVGATACPGENLYKLLPAIRDRVDMNLKSGSYIATANASTPSKNSSNQSTSNMSSSSPSLPVTKPNNIITLPTVYNTVKDSYAIRVRTSDITTALPRCEIIK